MIAAWMPDTSALNLDEKPPIMSESSETPNLSNADSVTLLSTTNTYSRRGYEMTPKLKVFSSTFSLYLKVLHEYNGDGRSTLSVRS